MYKKGKNTLYLVEITIFELGISVIDLLWTNSFKTCLNIVISLNSHHIEILT